MTATEHDLTPAAPATAAAPTTAAPTSTTGQSGEPELRMATLPTPVGTLTVVVDPIGVVRASWFGSSEAFLARVGRARTVPAEELGAVADAVARYVAGDVRALDDVPVHQAGGEFRQAAWAAMRRVPAGTTVSYTELAEMTGRPRAVRASASACATNQVAPFVPCHRIVRSDGTMGGYAYGLAVKQALLDHERTSQPGLTRRA